MIQKIKFLLKILIGILIIILVIWNRFFRTRIGYNFDTIESITYFRMVIITTLAILFIILFINSLFKFQESILFKSKNKIVSYFYETLEITFNFFFYKIPAKWNTGQHLHNLGFYLYKNLYMHENKLLAIHALLVIIPRSIVCISFCYSVFILKNLSFFFSVLIFLLLPLLLLFFKYMFKNFVKTNKNILETQLEITEIEPGKYSIVSKIDFESQIQFDEYANTLIELNCIDDLITRYELLIQGFFFKYQIIMYLIYACSWTYLFSIFYDKLS